MKRACLFFIGDIARDSRALRFLDALSGSYEVHALVAGEKFFVEERDGFILHSIPSLNASSFKQTFLDFRKRAAEIGRQLYPQLCIASDIYSLPAAIASAAKRKGKVIYDSRELYTSLASLVDRPITQLFWKQFEKRYARKADLLLTVNESIAAILRKKYPLQRIEVIHNYPILRGFERTGLLRSAYSIGEEKKILLSQGGLQKGRGAFLLVDAMRELPDCALVFLGSGPLESELCVHAEKQGVARQVFHHPAIPSHELLAYTASADIGLCLIENMGQSYYLSLPNKLFEYIAAGIPVIGSDFPEISSVIKKHDVGLTVDPLDNSQIIATVKQIVRDEKIRTRFRQNAIAASKLFNWNSERVKFQAFLNELHR